MITHDTTEGANDANPEFDGETTEEVLLLVPSQKSHSLDSKILSLASEQEADQKGQPPGP